MNKIAKTLLVVSAIAALAAGWLGSQEKMPADPWAKLRFLVGTWSTEGLNKPEEGVAIASFSLELDYSIIVRKNRVEFPPRQEGGPAVIHEDLLVIYPQGKQFRAIYFDNEKHVIEYSLQFPEGKRAVVFETENVQGPKFKLVYELLPDRTLASEFYIAQTGGDFNLYLKGKAKQI